ncbi:hypothetical protein DFH08DRAFT_411246 [Mycena albidolilacea]|uniref:Uncharacterized protein n=1 Tax=Mycena albidolilacea TaxID=1033008 RepID=A0AAD7AI21_9AGAR|nr:hypothetical protein DFH08DRAFT_411246 [Mycena albidolilacea]
MNEVGAARREATRAARALRQRDAEERQMLEDEASVLRPRAAELRNVRADLGLPPPPAPPENPAHVVYDEKEMERLFGPEPICSPTPSDMEFKIYWSRMAQRRGRRRRLESRQALEEEVVALRAEVLDFHTQMRLVGTGLSLKPRLSKEQVGFVAL